MLKADFHIHTDRSKCSNMSPETVVRRAREAGLDVIGVTDHNRTDGGLEVQRLARGDPLVIPGEEVMTEWGELMVLPSDGKYGGSAIDVCKRARRKGALVIVPHPFDITRNAPGRHARKLNGHIDAIETHNARCTFKAFNKRAERLADELGVAKVAGSDAHFAGEIGACANLLDCRKDIASVLECVRKGGFRTEQKDVSPVKRHIQTFVHGIKRRLSRP